MTDSLMTPDQIVQQWSEDSKVDYMNLSNEISRNGNLHSYYLDLYLKYRIRRRKAITHLENVDKFQTDYLKGRVQVDGKFYPFKLMNEEFKTYKKANNDFQKASEKLEAIEIGIDILKEILDHIKQRSFDLRAIKDMRKLESGE